LPLQFPVLYKSTDSRTDLIVKNAVDTAIADAEKLWSPEKFDGVYPVKGFGISRLKAADLIAAGSIVGPFSKMFTWSVTTASAWETYINDVTLSKATYVVICGVYNLDAAPDVEAMKINADGIEYPVIDLNEIYGWDVAVAYFSHPIIVRPEKKLGIKLKARTVGRKNIGFIGYTVGTRSYLIGEL